jgi:hypothetical protein
MTTPRPEADMLHMQHAQVAALLARQQEAARLRAQRDAAAKLRATTQLEPEPAPDRSSWSRAAHRRPRPV